MPIVPDEARTFGMEGMFRQLGIFAPEGQKYEPVDKDQVMYYREDKQGQILEEGINEAGAFSSWIAAATSYSHSNAVTVPFYIFYSMFGMQRIGDLAWAAADQRARGFLLGATAGRTTLNGEGLQHEDGHSHILSSVIPNCVSYDPTFGYELAVIIHDGLRRMVTNQEDVFYYITLMNENYEHPAMPAGRGGGDPEGHVPAAGGEGESESARAAAGLGHDPARGASPPPSCWRRTGASPPTSGARPASPSCAATASPPSAGTCCIPEDKPRVPYVTRVPGEAPPGPVVAATDYMKTFADQIRPFVPQDRVYRVLGTDGFGRSDSRAKLRHFFEVNRYFVAIAALKALAESGEGKAKTVAEAIKKYGIDPEQAGPDHRMKEVAGPGHRGLQGSGGHRGPGEAGRHGRQGAVADHARVGQGDDGDPVAGRRRGEGAEGQGRRQGVARAR